MNRKRLVLYILFGLFILISLLFFYFLFSKKPNTSVKKNKNISYIVDTPKVIDSSNKILGFSTKERLSSLELEKELEKIIAEYPQKVSLGLYFLDSNESIKINQKKVYPFDSFINLVIALSLLEKVQKNSLDLKTYVSGKRVDFLLSDLFNLKNAKNSQSALIKLLKPAYINKKIKEYGLKDTNIDRNETSISDVLLLWKKIYLRTYLDSNYTEYLLTLVSNEDSPLLKPIPLSTSVFSIYSSKENVFSESILVSNSNSYILVVFSKNLSDLELGVLYTKISKLVYSNSK